MTFGPVIPGAGLTEDEVIRPENLTERAGSDRVHGAGLKIHEDGAWDVPAAAGLVVIDVDALELEVGVAAVTAGGVDAVLVADDFPELGADLVAAPGCGGFLSRLRQLNSLTGPQPERGGRRRSIRYPRRRRRTEKRRVQPALDSDNLAAEIRQQQHESDACRLSLVSRGFRSAAESDAVWSKFLPSEIPTLLSLSGPDAPNFRSKSKELYLALCENPVLIDEGRMVSFPHRYGVTNYTLSCEHNPYGYSNMFFGLGLCLCFVENIWFIY